MKAIARRPINGGYRSWSDGKRVHLLVRFTGGNLGRSPVTMHATTDLAPGGVCPFLGQEAWVSAVGRFDPCCAPDAQRRTLGELGNLNEHGLMEIWNGAAYRELAASYRNRSLCIGCNMRKPARDS